MGNVVSGFGGAKRERRWGKRIKKTGSEGGDLWREEGQGWILLIAG